MKKIMTPLIPALLILASCSAIAAEQKEEKHPDDPTKVITRAGISYTDDLTLSGSWALDDARKINVRTNKDASEWRIGGSWLFDFGILNFNLSRSEYENGGNKNNYSVGTFIPLEKLGVNTGKWKVFPMAGINHNVGETPAQENGDLRENFNPMSNDTMVQNTTSGGYLGFFALRPITAKLNIRTFGGVGRGSNDYENSWIGAGVGYIIDERQSINLFAYTYEFK